MHRTPCWHSYVREEIVRESVHASFCRPRSRYHYSRPRQREDPPVAPRRKPYCLLCGMEAVMLRIGESIAACLIYSYASVLLLHFYYGILLSVYTDVSMLCANILDRVFSSWPGRVIWR